MIYFDAYVFKNNIHKENEYGRFLRIAAHEVFGVSIQFSSYQLILSDNWLSYLLYEFAFKTFPNLHCIL